MANLNRQQFSIDNVPHHFICTVSTQSDKNTWNIYIHQTAEQAKAGAINIHLKKVVDTIKKDHRINSSDFENKKCFFGKEPKKLIVVTLIDDILPYEVYEDDLDNFVMRSGNRAYIIKTYPIFSTLI